MERCKIRDLSLARLSEATSSVTLSTPSLDVTSIDSTYSFTLSFVHFSNSKSSVHFQN